MPQNTDVQLTISQQPDLNAAAASLILAAANATVFGEDNLDLGLQSPTTLLSNSNISNNNFLLEDIFDGSYLLDQIVNSIPNSGNVDLGTFSQLVGNPTAETSTLNLGQIVGQNFNNQANLQVNSLTLNGLNLNTTNNQNLTTGFNDFGIVSPTNQLPSLNQSFDPYSLISPALLENIFTQDQLIIINALTSSD